MENAAEALKMAAAVLIFVGALTISVLVFSQARTTSEAVIYTQDNTKYYSYVDGDEQSAERIVGLETIIPTLYRYYREHYEVVFNLGTGNYLYETKTDPSKWSESYKGNTKIVSFDVTKEGARREAWVGSTAKYKKNLDDFLNGTGDYNGNSFIRKYKNTKFKETIGEYPYGRDEDNSIYNPETSVEIDGEVFEVVKSDKKRVITYTLIN